MYVVLRLLNASISALRIKQNVFYLNINVILFTKRGDANCKKIYIHIIFYLSIKKRNLTHTDIEIKKEMSTLCPICESCAQYL